MVDAPSSTTTSTAKPAAATVLAQNSWDRLAERVSTVFQVPCWSSLANTSPATTAVSSGSTHWVAKPRTSRARANPFSVANRPKSVSFGGRDWPWTTTTTATGATSAPSSTALARYCARSLRTSHRTTADSRGRARVAGAARTAYVAAIRPRSGCRRVRR